MPNYRSRSRQFARLLGGNGQLKTEVVPVEAPTWETLENKPADLASDSEVAAVQTNVTAVQQSLNTHNHDTRYLKPNGDGSQLTGIDALPSQTGKGGLFLTTDGTNASWQDPTPFTTAGGTVIEANGYRYHVFTSSGTFQVTEGSGNVEYFIVGGGGGGGSEKIVSNNYGGAGGGGAGGLIIGTAFTGTGGYPVVIGAGGSGGNNSGGNNGGNTTFNGITMNGGGRGGGWNQGGASGASGGGGGSTYGTTSGGGSIAGQGHNGGGGWYWSGMGGRGGSGGGYVGAGHNSHSSNWNADTPSAAGYFTDFSGTNLEYCKGGHGSGGGGANALGGAHGPANRGWGGGGASYRNGGNGSSGMVIIRYQI